jgi:hypothetical protein
MICATHNDHSVGIVSFDAACSLTIEGFDEDASVRESKLCKSRAACEGVIACGGRCKCGKGGGKGKIASYESTPLGSRGDHVRVGSPLDTHQSPIEPWIRVQPERKDTVPRAEMTAQQDCVNRSV